MICVFRPLLPALLAWSLSGHPDALALARVADSVGVPRDLLWAVAWVETRHNLNPHIRGAHGELGRLQVDPKVWTARFSPHCAFLREYHHNLVCGALVLRYWRRETGSWLLAVERYNGRGPAAVLYRRKVEAELGRIALRAYH